MIQVIVRVAPIAAAAAARRGRLFKPSSHASCVPRHSTGSPKPAGSRPASVNCAATALLPCLSTKSAISDGLISTPPNPPIFAASSLSSKVAAETPIAPGLSPLYIVFSLIFFSHS